ncbi:MAG: retropepsin-like aspartic protease [Draconibacterium sp.]
MNRINLLLAIALFLYFPVLSSRAQIPVTEVTKSLQKAINQQDTAPIIPYLAPNFSVYTSTWPGSKGMLKRIFDDIEKDCTVEISKAKPKSIDRNRTSVKVNFIFESGTRKSRMVLNHDGKIEYITYIDERYGMSHDRPSKLVGTVPFTFEDDKIMVKLRLNDSPRELNFLFDTGADGMAITNSLADSIGIKVSHKQSTSVVGGNTDVQISSGNTVHLGAVLLPNKNMALFPDKHLKVDGILGLSVANNYIVEVDFDAGVLRLYSFGKFKYPKKSHTIPVTVPSGVAVLNGTLNLTGEKEFDGQFIFDTGAKFSLVGFEGFVRKNRLLLSGFKYDKVGSMASFNHNTMIYTGKSQSFSLGDKELETKGMPVTLQASNGKNDWTPDADGSLGIGFSQHYNFIINLVDKEINFRERMK